ncbi:hypothetical protein Tco_0506637 [Tanacetum coccineum]
MSKLQPHLPNGLEVEVVVEGIVEVEVLLGVEVEALEVVVAIHLSVEGDMVATSILKMVVMMIDIFVDLYVVLNKVTSFD